MQARGTYFLSMPRCWVPGRLERAAESRFGGRSPECAEVSQRHIPLRLVDPCKVGGGMIWIELKLLQELDDSLMAGETLSRRGKDGVDQVIQTKHRHSS